VPTYSYACTACEHRFDTVQAFSDSSLTDCPECTGRLRKLFSSVGIVFKGSGFYRTDSRTDPARASGEGKDESKSDSAKSDPAKSDSAKSESAKSGSAKSDSAKSSSGKPGSGSGTSSSGSSSSSSTPATAAS
jgi:putative FmdB family regulatory protein